MILVELEDEMKNCTWRSGMHENLNETPCDGGYNEKKNKMFILKIETKTKVNTGTQRGLSEKTRWMTTRGS